MPRKRNRKPAPATAPLVPATPPPAKAPKAKPVWRKGKRYEANTPETLTAREMRRAYGGKFGRLPVRAFNRMALGTTHEGRTDDRKEVEA